MRPRRRVYIDSPLSRFLGACVIMIVVALAALWFFGLLGR